MIFHGCIEMKVGFVEHKVNLENPSKSFTRISVYKASRPKGIDETQLFKMKVMVFGKHAEQASKVQKGETIFCIGEVRPDYYKNKEGVIEEGLTMFADSVDSFGFRQAAEHKGGPSKAVDEFPFKAPAETEAKVTPFVPDEDIPF